MREGEATPSGRPSVITNPLDLDSLLEDILLRSIRSAAYLASAMSVSHRWCRMISDQSFLKKFRDCHPSSPLVGVYIVDREDAPSFYDDPALAGLHYKAYRGGDFTLSRLKDRPWWCIRDCHNGRLLLSGEGPRGADDLLCIYNPLTERRVPIGPRSHLDHDGKYLGDCLLDGLARHMVSVEQRGQQMQAEESFRVISLQRQSRSSSMVRAIEYNSDTLEWIVHPKAKVQSTKFRSKAMYAANHIFWRTDDTLLLVLDTSTMEFSERALPWQINSTRCAIGELQDGETCLVCLQGLNIPSCTSSTSSMILQRHLEVRFEVWAWEEEEEEKGKEKKCWNRKENVLVSDILGEDARVYKVNKVINGLAVVGCTKHFYVIDLRSMKRLVTFKSGEYAYPYQMPWPPAAVRAVASVVSSHRRVNLSTGESAQIPSNNRDGQEGTSASGLEPDIRTVSPEGEESESWRRTKRTSLRSESQATRLGTKPSNEESAQIPSNNRDGQEGTSSGALEPGYKHKNQSNPHLEEISNPEVHISQTQISEQHDIGEKSSQDLCGGSARIQPMEVDPFHDELTLQAAGIFPSASCDAGILEDKSETNNLPKNTTEDEVGEQESNTDDCDAISSRMQKASACSICKNPNTVCAVCADVQDPPCHITIPMMPCYMDGVNVPCVSRHLIGSVLVRPHSEAVQTESFVGKFLFETQEALQYEVQINHGEGTTTIHGEGWKKFLNDYVVRLRDTVHICCHRPGITFYVKVERDGVQLSPSNFIAFNGLSDKKMHIIDKCVYQAGVHLCFHQASKMVHGVFGLSKNICLIYVHKMTTTDIGPGPLVIPNKVVERLKQERVHLDKAGELFLGDGDEKTQVEASYKTECRGGRMEIRKGFPEYARRLRLKVDQVVALAFQKRKDHHRINVCFSILG